MVVITHNMSARGQRPDSPRTAKTLITVAWVSSVAALPVCFFAVMGLNMGPSTPTISAGEFLTLAAGPGVACAALFEVTARCRVTASRLLALIVRLIVVFG